MSERRSADTQAAMQLLLAFAGVVLLVAVHWLVGLAAIATLAIAWPAVPFGTPRPLSVLKIYAPWALLWLLLTFGYLHGMAALGMPVEPQPALLELVEGGVAAAGFASSLLVVTIVAPFFEEVLFRGYLFTALAKALPMWSVQLVVALVFGVVHGYGHALPIALLSLAFGYLRQKHGTLLPSMLAHAVHNAATVMLMVCWPGLLDLFYAR